MIDASIILFTLICISVSVSLASYMWIFIHNLFKCHIPKLEYLLLKILVCILVFPVILIFYFFLSKEFKEIAIPINQPDVSIVQESSKYMTFNDISYGNHKIIYAILLIWFTITAAILIYHILANQIYKAQLIRIATPISDPETLYLLHALKEQLNIYANIKLYSCYGIRSPFIIGFFHPIIVLSKNKLDEEELELILGHELMHCKSNDLLFRYGILFIQALYWWNPLIYRFAGYFCEIEELACDTKLLQSRNVSCFLKYASLIVNMGMHEEHNSTVLVGKLSGNKNNILMRRLENIMNINKKKNALKTTLVIIGSSLCFPISAYASTMGLLSMQNELITSIERYSNPVVTATPINFPSYNSVLTYDEKNNSENLDPRSANNIDLDLKTSKIYKLTITAKSESMVISLKADSSSDNFQIKISEPDGKVKVVNSKDGYVSYFTNKTKGEIYTIYMINKSSTTIHVAGSVTV